MASVRNCEELPLCLIKPVLAVSKTVLPLPKAKPIGNGGSASVITVKAKKKKTTSAGETAM